MEKTINSKLKIHINIINKIIVSNERCVICAETTEYGTIKLIFDDVWDCRYTIENGIIDRYSKMTHEENVTSSIYEVVDSLYINYFEHQVSGTRPISHLKDYLLFDDVDTVFEVLSLQDPYIEKD